MSSPNPPALWRKHAWHHRVRDVPFDQGKTWLRVWNSESVEGIISSEFRAGSASLNCQLVLALGRDTDDSPDLGTVRRDHVQSIQSLSDMSDSRSAWRGCHSNAEAGSKEISAAGESCEDPGCSLSIGESPVSTRIIKGEVIQGVS